MAPISLQHLIAATGGRAAGIDARAAFGRVSIDSRTIEPGDLFWAIRGPQRDGHDYIDDALSRGAAGCVVQQELHGTAAAAGKPLVFVENTLAALWNLARRHRSRCTALTIGITGSLGKTTTREAVYAVLSAGRTGMQSPHNFNNHLGLPLTILEMETIHQFAVLELGASHVGEIRQLAEVAAPHIGVLTAIAPAHLDGFGSLQGVVQAKGELLEALPRHGLAVLNGDDPAVRAMAARGNCPALFVGAGPENHFRASNIVVNTHGLEFRVEGRPYRFQAAGAHHLTAALAALAIGRELGLTAAQTAEGLESFVPPPGRCRVETIGPWTVIDDTYNASPRSMQAACRLLQDWQTAGRRFLVVGDMLELGPQTRDFHRQLGAAAARTGIDHLLAYGCQAEHVAHEALNAGMDAHRLAHCTELKDLFTALHARLEPGDVVLVKGSRGMQMERVVAWLRGRAAHDMENTNAGAHKPAFV